MSRSRGILAASLALAILGGGLRAQHRVDLVRVELTGPTEEVRLHAGAGETVVDISLAEGEQRSLMIPLLARGTPGPDGEPEFLGAGAEGHGRFLEGTRSSAPPWNSLAPGLRRRSLPTLGADRPRPGRARLALLVAAALVALGLRRRPAGSLLVGAVAAVLIAVLPSRPSTAREVRVIEHDRARERSLEVIGGRDRVSLSAPECGWIRCLPSAPGLWLEVEVRGQESRWTAHATGARLFFQRESEVSLPEELRKLHLERVWIREPGEAWCVQDGWNPAGSAPFEGREGGPAPPGWLVSAVPQGVRVLLGRGSGPENRTTWLRAW